VFCFCGRLRTVGTVTELMVLAAVARVVAAVVAIAVAAREGSASGFLSDAVPRGRKDAKVFTEVVADGDGNNDGVKRGGDKSAGENETPLAGCNSNLVVSVAVGVAVVVVGPSTSSAVATAAAITTDGLCLARGVNDKLNGQLTAEASIAKGFGGGVCNNTSVGVTGTTGCESAPDGMDNERIRVVAVVDVGVDTTRLWVTERGA